MRTESWGPNIQSLQLRRRKGRRGRIQQQETEKEQPVRQEKNQGKARRESQLIEESDPRRIR